MPKRTARQWLDQISAYHDAFKPWETNGRKIVDRYRLESFRSDSSRTEDDSSFNILWSNVQTQKPAIFSRLPMLVAERRHKDKDPLGRVCSEIIERAGNEEMERNNFKESMDQVTLDVLLPGRGVPWVRFEADPIPDIEVKLVELEGGIQAYMSDDGEQFDPDDVGEEKGKLVVKREGMTNERVMVDYVHWQDFAHSPDRTWADVERSGWVARRIALTKAEGRERFGQKFDRVGLTLAARTTDPLSKRQQDGRQAKYGEVWEIWDMATRMRIFVAKGLAKPLEEEPDPYGIEKFLPCPRPAYATLTNEDLIPVADYLQYIDLAEELDDLTVRIRYLTRSLKLVGVHDASAEGVGSLLQSDDGTMVPVANFAELVGKSAPAGGGLNGVVQFLPIAEVANTLIGLYGARDQVKQTLYEVSGVSDIVRGEVDPREKASQSRIKAQFASQRLDQRRRSVERCARDVARIQVELMVELYSPETLREQSGFDQLTEIQKLDEGTREQVWKQSVELIQSDKARGFRIDVETDSTIEMDANQQQESRVEFMTAAGNFLGNVFPLVQAAPQLANVVGELMLFTVRSYRAGRTLESTFEEAVDQTREAIEQAQQQGGQGDPEAEAAAAREQQKMQIEGQKGQMELQRMQQQGQIEAQKGALELQQENAELQQKAQELEADRDRIEAERRKLELELEAKRVAIEGQRKMQQAAGRDDG